MVTNNPKSHGFYNTKGVFHALKSSPSQVGCVSVPHDVTPGPGLAGQPLSGTPPVIVVEEKVIMLKLTLALKASVK